MTEHPLQSHFAGSSRLGFGCMGLGGSWDPTPLEDADREHAFAALDAAVAAGITLFDHADIYRHGKAERVFGEWLGQRPGLRERLIIQSKGGICLASAEQPQHYDLSGENIQACVEGSLQRLGIEQLDLWLLHRPDPLWEPAEIADTFNSLRESGLVRHFGVSNMHQHQIALLQAYLDLPLVVNQLQMSLAHRPWLESDVSYNTDANGNGTGTVDYCRGRYIQLQAWGSLAGGRFSGRAEATDGPTAALVAELADQRGCAPEAIVLAWLLRHPAGIQPLVGTSNPERIAACAAAPTVTLSRTVWYALYTAARGEALP